MPTRKIPKTVKVTSVSQAKDIVRGKQGQRLIEGITHALCGSTGLSAGFIVMPAGRVANVHLHEKCESIIFIIEGWAATTEGEDFEPHFHGPGDFIFIPEGVVHAAINLSNKHRVIAVEMRNEKHFNEDVVVFPELNPRLEKVAADLRAKFEAGELPLPSGWKELLGRPFEFIEDLVADQLYADPKAEKAAS
jgi:uncharacterized RmlC-like cupin family protein